MFKKSDLKTGMMIETVGKGKYIIMLDTDKLGDIAYNVDKKTYFGLDTYDENMIDDGSDLDNWNVVKVYDGVSILRETDDDIEGRLLWEREKEKVFDMGDSKVTLRYNSLFFTDGVLDTVLRDEELNWFIDALTNFFTGKSEWSKLHYGGTDCISIHKEGIQLLVDGIGMLIDYPNARKLLTWLKENKDE
jgi:hypothetical protein